ncbi:MAG: hypothetical protein ACO1SV_19910 [Fimbriimonas sp.]
MVSRFLVLAAAVGAVAGCSDPIERSAQKGAPASVDEQIKRIENTPGMPDDVKARTIEGLRQQQAAKAAGKPANAGS